MTVIVNGERVTAATHQPALPSEAMRDFDRAAHTARQLRHHGVRHPYGLSPAASLTAGQLREVMLIERAVARLIAIDRKLRQRGNG